LYAREIKLSALENKTQVCVDYWTRGGLVAFGGSDGIIRVWSISDWEVRNKLVGAPISSSGTTAPSSINVVPAHTKAVTCVLCYEVKLKDFFKLNFCKNVSAHILVSGGADGKLCLWEVGTEFLKHYIRVSNG
jgi:WD40 repeat protein